MVDNTVPPRTAARAGIAVTERNETGQYPVVRPVLGAMGREAHDPQIQFPNVTPVSGDPVGELAPGPG